MFIPESGWTVTRSRKIKGAWRRHSPYLCMVFPCILNFWYMLGVGGLECISHGYWGIPIWAFLPSPAICCVQPVWKAYVEEKEFFRRQLPITWQEQVSMQLLPPTMWFKALNPEQGMKERRNCTAPNYHHFLQLFIHTRLKIKLQIMHEMKQKSTVLFAQRCSVFFPQHLGQVGFIVQVW